MGYVLLFLIGTAVSWVTLLIVIPVAQKLADFSMPPWSEMLWKLAVVAVAGSVVAAAVTPIHPWLSWIVGAIVFWVFMVKWFDIDLFAAIVIVVVSWVVRAFLETFVVMALTSAGG